MWWLALLACSAEEPNAPYATPDARGPWEAVAYEASLVSRSGLSLPLEVWYPTAATGESRHRYGDIIEGEALVDGPAACDTPRPVVVFSHGNQGLRYQSYFLSEWLAQHGYIVLAPDHVYNTLMDWVEERGSSPKIIRSTTNPAILLPFFSNYVVGCSWKVFPRVGDLGEEPH